MIKCLVHDSGQNVKATGKSHRNVVTFQEWKFVSYTIIFIYNIYFNGQRVQSLHIKYIILVYLDNVQYNSFIVL